MQYPYGISGRRHHATAAAFEWRSRVARKMHHSPAHELAALPRMTPVGKPAIVPVTGIN
jgi:hypothetical protein